MKNLARLFGLGNDKLPVDKQERAPENQAVVTLLMEQGWDRLAYLDNLCLKAGLPMGSWREPGAQLYWYEAVVFKATD